MQSEGIAWQANRYAVIDCHVHRKRAWRSDPLYGDLFRRQSDLVLLCLLHDLINECLVCRVRIGSAHHCDIAQVVLERVVGEFRRNDLKPAVDQPDNQQKPAQRFNRSHVPTIASWDRTYPARRSTP